MSESEDRQEPEEEAAAEGCTEFQDVDLSKDFLQLLHESGCISQEIATALIRFKDRWQVGTFEALIECHIFSEPELADLIAKLYKLRRVFTIEECLVDHEFTETLPFKLAKRLALLPLRRKGDRSLLLIAGDPTLAELKADLQKAVGSGWQMAVAEQTRVHEAIERLYPLEHQVFDPGLRTEPAAQKTEQQKAGTVPTDQQTGGKA